MYSKIILKTNSKRTKVQDCSIIHLPKIENIAGNITPVQNRNEIPFDIQRIYYLYDIPGGAERGGHAHIKLHQIIIALSGSFNILVKDGINQKIFKLKYPDIGLYIIPGLWRELLDFSTGTICLVLASEKYDESDYIRNYKEYLKFKY